MDSQFLVVHFTADLEREIQWTSSWPANGRLLESQSQHFEECGGSKLMKEVCTLQRMKRFKGHQWTELDVISQLCVVRLWKNILWSSSYTQIRKENTMIVLSTLNGLHSLPIVFSTTSWMCPECKKLNGGTYISKKRIQSHHCWYPH